MIYGIQGALLQRQYGLSYFLSTLFFPVSLRRHVFALYGMVRVADNLVDSPLPADTRRENILAYQRELEKELIHSSVTRDRTAKDFAQLAHTYGFKKKHIDAFFKAMKQDTDPNFRYRTYQDLENYMYGSAAVIGYMMSSIIGYEKEALPYAKKLAEAMQLTNFLRDVKEDYQQFGRIYIPEEDLDLFGLTREQFVKGDGQEAFRKLIEFEVQRARLLFKESEPGIALLHVQGQPAVKMASCLYQAILDNIECSGYRAWSISAKTSTLQKLSLLFLYAWKKK